jgi:hypothetical protein
MGIIEASQNTVLFIGDVRNKLRIACKMLDNVRIHKIAVIAKRKHASRPKVGQNLLLLQSDVVGINDLIYSTELYYCR